MLEQIAFIYKINNGLVKRALEGLSDDQVWQAPPGGGNPLGWLLGHITETRTGLLYAFGRRIEGGWSGRRFSRGSMLEARSSYPSRAEIEARWNATHAAMRDVFAAFTPEQLAAPATIQLPGTTTMADQTAFVAFHESYHVGQMAFVRKQNGHSAIAG
jgi:uncharacterized damage-inducible protein DinB